MLHKKMSKILKKIINRKGTVCILKEQKTRWEEVARKQQNKKSLEFP